MDRTKRKLNIVYRQVYLTRIINRNADHKPIIMKQLYSGITQNFNVTGETDPCPDGIAEQFCQPINNFWLKTKQEMH